MLSGDRLHQVLCECRAFGFGRRRDRFDLSPVPARGFTPVRYRQGQLQLVWRSHCGHETSDLLALSFNPSSGTVRAFGRRIGLLCPLLTSAPRSGCFAASSVPGDTAQISRGKLDNAPRTPAGFTVPALDGNGLRGCLPARPTDTASYPISVRRVAILLHASFRQSLAVLPLRFATLHLHQVVRGLPPPSCRTCSTHRLAAERPPRRKARLGLERASTAANWRGRGSGGTAQGFLFVLVQIVHVEVAMLFEPVLMSLDC